MPNRAKAKMVGDEVVAVMAEVARQWPVLSEEERRRMLDEYAPLMAVLQTLWHVVDPAAPEAEQPAVIRTFSSRSATREDVRRFLAGSN